MSRLYKTTLILGIAVTFLTIPVFWFAYSAPVSLEVDFLDVGQGDSILIKSPYGQNILIDGGPDNSVISELDESLGWWDRRIDLMILSHPHDDHVAGLIDVTKRFRVEKAAYTGVDYDSPAYLEWLKIIGEKGVGLVIIDRPQKINLGDDCYLDILYPRNSYLGKTVDNINNSSIVIKLNCGLYNFLFTGDAENEIEHEFTEAYESDILQAKVLKVGHHGSDTSSGLEFLAAVRPEIAVIQVGEDNDFGHPSRRVMKRLERLGTKIYRNDLEGTIRVASDGQIVSANP